MNGNVQDELGLITEFQTAVLKALKPVILEMDPTAIQGWIGNSTALKQVLKESLCPTPETLLELPLSQVFTPERCVRFHPRTRALCVNQIRNELQGSVREKVRLKDLLACNEQELRKFPNIGSQAVELVNDVLSQLGLKLRP